MENKRQKNAEETRKPSFKESTYDFRQEIERNKESLKIKLSVRRPIEALIHVGILPSPKTSPSLHEQRTKLERAKMGDMLRSKIAHRPQREELIHRHILQDVRAGVDPSLCEKQLLLKRAKLADSLSCQLSVRPGPLELIQKNILHSEDEKVEKALKEGEIEFLPTNEGLLSRPWTLDEDDDSNSEGKVGISESPQRIASRSSQSPLFLSSSTFPEPSAYSQRSAPGKDQSVRKKTKVNKSACKTTKPRTIKFHEYKGPPNQRKHSDEGSSESLMNNSSPYDLLLKQQQLYLQWQLQNKNTKMILPAQRLTTSSKELPLTSPDFRVLMTDGNSKSQPEVSNAIHLLSRLEDMKVGDIKVELKKRNLTVSGPKPLLIERLKPHLEAQIINSQRKFTVIKEQNLTISSSSSSSSLSSSLSFTNLLSRGTELMETNNCSVIGTTAAPPPPPPPPPPPSMKSHKICVETEYEFGRRRTSSSLTPEEIIQNQRRKIEELQLALHKSQKTHESLTLSLQNPSSDNNIDVSELNTSVSKSSSLPDFNHYDDNNKMATLLKSDRSTWSNDKQSYDDFDSLMFQNCLEEENSNQNVEFSTLDFSDLPLNMFQEEEKQQFLSHVPTVKSMDVDQDVADWLDSLLPFDSNRINSNNSFSCTLTNEINGNSLLDKSPSTMTIQTIPHFDDDIWI